MTSHDQQKRRGFSFGTKAETLERISPLLSLCQIPDFTYFSVKEWQSEEEKILFRLVADFSDKQVIVRSSAEAEDSGDNAMAGQFVSIPRVNAGDAEELRSAIDQVISSYRRHNGRAVSNDQVIVQYMIDDVLMSGVLFTRDLNTGAPYYAINYDDETGRTDTVTSGGEYSNRTLYVHKGARDALRSARFQALISAVAEIETLIDGEALDIEFAVDSQFSVHLFQVRRVTSHANWSPDVVDKVDEMASHVRTMVRERMAPKPGVFGSRPVFGQMPDWNPAEIIGRAPRALALSLYRHLITDRVWREARKEMGYHVPEGEALLVSLGGQPYVDARLSFHSFLPNSLPDTICHKLVDAWLERLVAHPQLHDKVEFDVAMTSFAFDFDIRAVRQVSDALSRTELAEFRAASKDLTFAHVKGDISPIDGELARIEQLKGFLDRTISKGDESNLPEILDECIDLGTRPFSKLARHGFIAQSILRSLIATEIFTDDQANRLMRSIRTVASEFADDTRRVIQGDLKREDFFRSYGHLRPGTYDILSARYDQRQDLLGEEVPSANAMQWDEFHPASSQFASIEKLMKTEGLDMPPEELINYIRAATTAREYAKFVFTRGLSDSLEIISHWGDRMGLSRDDLSHLEIDVVLAEIAAGEGGGRQIDLKSTAGAGRINHQTTQALRLPQLLFDEEGVHVIPFQLSEPNFVTHKVARGQCVKLGRHDSASVLTAGAIVLIENADPGFDWIFAHHIGGLVTKFGGTNSHMAIRCAEFGIPAAIGCGEQIFERISTANAVEINCAEGHIRPID